MMKRTWIVAAVAALGLATAACGGGGKAACEKIMKKAAECSGQKMATEMVDQLAGPLCEQDEAQEAAKKVSSCLDESSCDAFKACMQKSGGGDFDMSH